MPSAAALGRSLLALALTGLVAAPSCARSSTGATALTSAAQPPAVVSARVAASATLVASAVPSASVKAFEIKPDPRDAVHDYLSARLPRGGVIVTRDGRPSIDHTTETTLTPLQIAALYLEVTDVYSAQELADAIAKPLKKPRHLPLPKGTTVTIPRVLAELPVESSKARLGWPADRSMRGIYVTADMAAAESFPKLVQQVAAHGMNALVVDAKDVTGTLGYPSEVPLAVETGAAKSAPMGSFSRMVRAAHAQGVRVIGRVSCFRDEYLARRREPLALQRQGGGAHRNPHGVVDWLDPSNEEVQLYLLGVIDEVLAAGVDEVQLDYVRYPTEGVGDADFKLAGRQLTTRQVIGDWVKRVHGHTKPAGVPLSLDVFGIVAWGFDADMNSTGQDLARLGPEIEALSPMVYPSHFADGFNGYEIAGAHPEIVGIGTLRAIEALKRSNPTVVVRPWVQAFPYKSPGYGAGYIAQQLASSEKVGGVGWLAWNSGGEYGATYAATALDAASRRVAVK